MSSHDVTDGSRGKKKAGCQQLGQVLLISTSRSLLTQHMMNESHRNSSCNLLVVNSKSTNSLIFVI